MSRTILYHTPNTGRRTPLQEEVEAYLAINGLVGCWGESMVDSIAVDIIHEALIEGHGLEVAHEVIETELQRQAKLL